MNENDDKRSDDTPTKPPRKPHQPGELSLPVGTGPGMQSPPRETKREDETKPAMPLDSSDFISVEDPHNYEKD